MNQKKFYVIYQITNNLNGKIYIGKHKTNNLDDDYMGSGAFLYRAKKKYGLENFTKTILFILHNEEEMNRLEKLVVTAEFCQREDVYNCMEGGQGGWDYVNLSCDYGAGSQKRKNALKLVNSNEAVVRKRSESCSQFWNNLKKSDEAKYEEFCKSVSNGVKEFNKKNPGFFAKENNPMHGYRWSEQQLSQLSEQHKGDKNAMFNVHWIHNEIFKLSFPVSEELFWMYIGEGWRKGRVLDWNKYVIPEQKELKRSKTKREKDLKKKETQQQKLELLYMMFNEFQKNEFDGVVEKFAYKNTRNNLIMAFKKHIPEYVPAKCNRWKNKCKG